FGLAGTCVTVTFSRPGSTKLRAPFLLTDPRTAPSNAALTARSALAATAEALAMYSTRPDLLITCLIVFGAAGFAADFGAAFFAFFAAMAVLLCCRGSCNHIAAGARVV